MPSQGPPPLDVARVARLARLALTETEAAELEGQLAAVLTYVDQIAGLDLTGVEPTTHAVPLSLALREDAPGPLLTRDEALANAPKHDGEAFIVPKVV